MNTYTKALFLLFTFSILSCDKDYNTIGSDIVGDENFNFENESSFKITAYTKPTGPVQTNNLPINALGIYKNPVFGTTKAHFVSQIEMVTSNPSVGYDSYIDSTLDSVYVYIPFFSTVKSTTDTGGHVYEIDSIYGDSEAKFNLKVHENGYALRDFDPNNNNEPQKYYSDFKPTIVANKGSELLNNSDNTNENVDFFFDKEEIVIYKTNSSGQFIDESGVATNDPEQYVVKERKAPGIWLNLKKSFFETKILNAVAEGKLYNNNIFKQHFRGLFFEVEEIIPGQGSMVNLNFNAAEIVMQYHYFTVENSTSPETDLKKGSLKFKMGYSSSSSNKSISINLFEFSEVNSTYEDALNGSFSDGSLFLKGGAKGSVVYLDLFDDNELAELRNKNWLINEANLVFYVDQSKMSSAEYEPLRIYLYDAINNRPMYDYYTDPTKGITSKNDKFVLGGLINKDDSGRVKYKMRITNHINNVLNETDNNENVRLGLVVTESINLVGNAALKTPFSLGTQSIEYLPVASVMNHLGTVLHGPESTATYIDDSGNVVPMKLKLEIYYTQPK